MSKSDKIQDGTVGKALSLLDDIAQYDKPVRFTTLLENSPFPKATLYRFLQTLTNQGMLHYDSTLQTYSLGLRLVRLAHKAWEQSSLAPIARSNIEALSANVGETVHLAQIENGQILFIDKCKANDMFETLARTGKVAPAYCTGVGKAILAFLPENQRLRAFQQQAFFPYTTATHINVDSLRTELEVIKVEGIAFDREEHERGIISIAAPILSPSNRIIGSLSIATSTARHSLQDLDKFRPALLKTARNIGDLAQAWQYPENLNSKIDNTQNIMEEMNNVRCRA